MSGHTRVDMRLTRHPANTPRARLHRLAAWGARCGHQLGALRFARVCEALTDTLVRLEALEVAYEQLQADNRTLRQDLAFERSHNEQLRSSLAAEQVRAAAALLEVPHERWEEPTRNRSLTADEKVIIDDPDARPVESPTRPCLAEDDPR